MIYIWIILTLTILMKSFKISSVLLLFVASLFLVSCDDEPIDNAYDGGSNGTSINFTAKIDGAKFESVGVGFYAFPGFENYYEDEGTFLLNAMAPIGNPLDMIMNTIDFAIIPFDGKGTYTYDASTADWIDTPIISYQYADFSGESLLYQAKEATITFTKFDEANGVASGTFNAIVEISLFDEDNFSASDYPDIQITNGKFTNISIMPMGEDNGGVGF